LPLRLLVRRVFLLFFFSRLGFKTPRVLGPNTRFPWVGLLPCCLIFPPLTVGFGGMSELEGFSSLGLYPEVTLPFLLVAPFSPASPQGHGFFFWHSGQLSPHNLLPPFRETCNVFWCSTVPQGSFLFLFPLTHPSSFNASCKKPAPRPLSETLLLSRWIRTYFPPEGASPIFKGVH